MNKIKPEQLQQLRHFILSRGIRESDVVDEILDHFACKIEELLEGAQACLPFERLMEIAHHSFGPTGFRPLIIRYEQELNKTMWRLYKQEVVKVLQSPLMLCIFGVGMLVIPGLRYCAQHYQNNLFFDFGHIAFLGIIIMGSVFTTITYRSVMERIKQNKVGKHYRYLWQQQVLSIPSIPVLLILPLAGIFMRPTAPSDLYFIFLALLMIFQLVRVKAQYNTYHRLKEKYLPKTEIEIR